MYFLTPGYVASVSLGVFGRFLSSKVVREEFFLCHSWELRSLWVFMRFHVQDGIVTNTFVHVGISTVTKNNNYLKVFKRVSIIIIIIIIIIMKHLYSGHTAESMRFTQYSHDCKNWKLKIKIKTNTWKRYQKYVLSFRLSLDLNVIRQLIPKLRGGYGESLITTSCPLSEVRQLGPQVLSYPPYVGWVGENPRNETIDVMKFANLASSTNLHLDLPSTFGSTG